MATAESLNSCVLGSCPMATKAAATSSTAGAPASPVRGSVVTTSTPVSFGQGR